MHTFKLEGTGIMPTEFTMSEDDIRDAIRELEYLIDCAKKGKVDCLSVGICGNWNTPYSYDLVMFYGASWDKTAHPGEPSEYPISRGYLGQTLWQGEQRDLRIDLMEHILFNLNEVLKEM